MCCLVGGVLDEFRFSARNVRELLEGHGFRFSKSLGQNFLVDANIPEKIVRLSGIDEGCCVLEVGPGIGALTSVLCKVAGEVVAVELDGRLLPILRDVLDGCQNVEVVQGDILKMDIGQLVSGKISATKRVCANLPYNITTPALTVLIEADVFESITVMIQREVAARICAKPGSPEYGAFTVYSNYHTKPEILFDVPPECFVPRPKVHSSVVTMKTRSEKLLNPVEEAAFFRVVRAAFGQRRKTLINALHAAFGNTMRKDEIADRVIKCGFDTKVRGETLGIEEFILLTRVMAQS